MIVSCAPFRVSFAGGGSDLPVFYRKSGGAVLSCAIAKYSFAIAHQYFNEHQYHLKYARTELVDNVDAISHPLFREALRMQEIGPGIEITSVADLPSGTGLGSSSSFAVALLNALHAFRSNFASKERLAAEACLLEIERLCEPIGKQDQYAAAFGGLNFIEFHSNDSVIVQPIILPRITAALLEESLLLLYTGLQRDARSVLSNQTERMRNDAQKFATVQRMVELAYDMRNLLSRGDLDSFGEALHCGWQMKRSLGGISDSGIDDLYERAQKAGATGGKLAGAGGGGFLVLYCPKQSKERVRSELSEFKIMDFRIDWAGARIAFAQ
jgi:D-glycero-alpha-D-manno-heptose-7-phosphate kinase